MISKKEKYINCYKCLRWQRKNWDDKDGRCLVLGKVTRELGGCKKGIEDIEN